MTKARKTIEELKNDLVGKVFGWLTILDVTRNTDSGRLEVKCICKCGNECFKNLLKVTSNHTTSCGCYKHSKAFANKIKQWCNDHPDEVKEQAEHLKSYYRNNPDKVKEISDKIKQWCNDHPDEVIARSIKHSQWCNDHPDEVKEQGIRHHQWFINNKDKIKEQGKLHSQWYKDHPTVSESLSTSVSKRYTDNRKAANIEELMKILKPCYIEQLLNGSIKAKDIIETKCPICNEYAPHALHNVFSFSSNCLKCTRICLNCAGNLMSSKAEQEIEEYISTFYIGKLIRNTRDIITPLELDLYYPEKKIAIEFNGDYWHDENHKLKDYHINKYLKCKEKGITLVSIFESEWNNRKDEIKHYLKDIFDGKENKLSFNEDHTLMNNNYPSLNIKSNKSMIEDFHVHNGVKVYTCGYTKLE